VERVMKKQGIQELGSYNKCGAVISFLSDFTFPFFFTLFPLLSFNLVQQFISALKKVVSI